MIAIQSSPRRALVPALFLLALLLAGCGGDVRSKTADGYAAEPAAPQDECAAPMPVAAKAAAEQKIHIDNFTFDPVEVTVAVGTKVTWINRDDVPHTATSTAKPRLFDSKALDTDQQFSFVFDKAGTYEYFCAVHPKMTGKIIVK